MPYGIDLSRHDLFSPMPTLVHLTARPTVAWWLIVPLDQAVVSRSALVKAGNHERV
jgi:hypothetical protein